MIISVHKPFAFVLDFNWVASVLEIWLMSQIGFFLRLLLGYQLIMD